jgi:hypothetical protein
VLDLHPHQIELLQSRCWLVVQPAADRVNHFVSDSCLGVTGERSIASWAAAARPLVMRRLVAAIAVGSWAATTAAACRIWGSSSLSGTAVQVSGGIEQSVS